MINALHMKRIGRRTFAGAAGLLPTLFLPGIAQATLLRGMPLRELTQRSAHVLAVTGLEARCSWALLGGRRMIVTETLVRIDAVVARDTPGPSEIVVRTLGGVLDGRGQKVHGQADFELNQRSVAFLTRAKDGTLWVTGMAQGHYPLLETAPSEQRLSASPNLPTLVDFEGSGVHALTGLELGEAQRLLRESSAR